MRRRRPGKSARLAPGSAPAEPAPELRSELWSYAWQMAALALFGAVLWDRSELAFLKVRSTYGQIGLYTAAFGLSLPVLRVPAVLSQVMLPLVAGMKGAQARPEDIGAALRRGVRLMSLLMIGPTCVLAAAAPAVVMVVFEEEYAEAGVLLRVLLLPMLLAGIGAVSSQVLVGAGGHSALLKITSWVASLKMWLLIVLVPIGGALGAAVFSFFLNPFFMFTLLAIGGAVSTIAYPWRIDPEDRPALKRLRWPPQVAGAAISVALVAIR